MADEPGAIGLDWRPLSVDDMKLVMDQADALSAGFSGQPGVERIFSLIATAAVNAMYARDTPIEAAGGVATDARLGPDIRAPDLEAARRYVARLANDRTQREAVRGLWRDVLVGVDAESERRELEG